MAKLYKELCNALQAYETCKKNGNTEWMNHWAGKAGEYMDLFPHGSGFDSLMPMPIYDTKKDILRFSFEYHHMDENGMYICWETYHVTVKAHLVFGTSIYIKAPRRVHCKDYLDYFYEIVNEWLFTDIPDRIICGPTISQD